MSRYSDPKYVDTTKMTDTYNVGQECQYKTVEDVLTKQGFRIDSVIDRGAFAVVFKANHIQNGTTVAVKMIEISPDLKKRKKDALINDIKNELYVLQKIRHPHIVLMITHFLIRVNTRDLLHIVMQFAEGGTLSKIANRFGPFDEESCRIWFAQMLDALVYMHTRFGMAHRDLKLSNILLDKDTDVLISDFGLSRVVWRQSRNGLMESKTFCGTPPYMAPEVREHEFVKKGYNAQKADVWALGVILFRLFNQEYPFNTNRQKVLKLMKARKWRFGKKTRHEPSDDLKDILTVMLEPEPSKRPEMKDLMAHKWVSHHFPGGKSSTPTSKLLHRKAEQVYRKSQNTKKT